MILGHAFMYPFSVLLFKIFIIKLKSLREVKSYQWKLKESYFTFFGLCP